MLESTATMFFFNLCKTIVDELLPGGFFISWIMSPAHFDWKIFFKKGQDDMTLQNCCLAYCLIKNLMILHNFGSGSTIIFFDHLKCNVIQQQKMWLIL